VRPKHSTSGRIGESVAFATRKYINQYKTTKGKRRLSEEDKENGGRPATRADKRGKENYLKKDRTLEQEVNSEGLAREEREEERWSKRPQHSASSWWGPRKIEGARGGKEKIRGKEQIEGGEGNLGERKREGLCQAGSASSERRMMTGGKERKSRP